MKNAITINFLDKSDKETTSDILNNIKAKTGKSHPVILNHALRLYYNGLKIEEIIRNDNTLQIQN